MRYSATNEENKIQIFDTDAIGYVGTVELINGDWHWQDYRNEKFGTGSSKLEAYKQLCESCGVRVYL